MLIYISSSIVQAINKGWLRHNFLFLKEAWLHSWLGLSPSVGELNVETQQALVLFWRLAMPQWLSVLIHPLTNDLSDSPSVNKLWFSFNNWFRLGNLAHCHSSLCHTSRWAKSRQNYLRQSSFHQLPIADPYRDPAGATLLEWRYKSLTAIDDNHTDHDNLISRIPHKQSFFFAFFCSVTLCSLSAPLSVPEGSMMVLWVFMSVPEGSMCVLECLCHNWWGIYWLQLSAERALWTRASN